MTEEQLISLARNVVSLNSSVVHIAELPLHRTNVRDANLSDQTDFLDGTRNYHLQTDAGFS